MSKLTKKQLATFENFTKNILVNTMLVNLSHQGVDITTDDVENIKGLIATVDTKALSTKIGLDILSKIEYKEFQRVEKFLLLPETIKVMDAAREVGTSVQEEVVAIITELVNPPAQ